MFLIAVLASQLIAVQNPVPIIIPRAPASPESIAPYVALSGEIAKMGTVVGHVADTGPASKTTVCLLYKNDHGRGFYSSSQGSFIGWFIARRGGEGWRYRTQNDGLTQSQGVFCVRTVVQGARISVFNAQLADQAPKTDCEKFDHAFWIDYAQTC